MSPRGDRPRGDDLSSLGGSSHDAIVGAWSAEEVGRAMMEQAERRREEETAEREADREERNAYAREQAAAWERRLRVRL